MTTAEVSGIAPAAGAQTAIERRHIIVGGAVQGVGFRPYVYRLACAESLAGWVRNDPAGVVIEVEGPRVRLDRFAQRLRAEAPSLAGIADVRATTVGAIGEPGFRVRRSDAVGRPAAVVLPDVATCPACRAEIFDPTQRRYRYPFTNCTDCGPRFTIVDRLPYDRAHTSMAGFPMCPACRAEYEDPADRRFHAQPIACPACGPRVSLVDGAGRLLDEGDAAMRAAARALLRGRVVAARGLGGFHLLLDAADDDAVQRLRRAKARDHKPFALLYADVAAVRRDCDVDPAEVDLLTSPAAPIVLLRRRPDAAIAASVAPEHPLLGVMLPSTPLHHLLLADVGRPLVATSGNVADETICIGNDEARQRLAGMADLFLLHDRPIRRHADDSIVRLVAGRPLVLRRGRGFAPWPLPAPRVGRDAVAYGGQIKGAAAVATRGRVVLGQHVGDLEHPAAQDTLARVVDDLQRLHGLESEPLRLCDTHPDYDSTRLARRAGTCLPVQHHVAHVHACLLDNGLLPPALGVAFDGAGLGFDGQIWGGEFLRVLPGGAVERVAHLRRFRLPGGDAAAREPRRAALGVLHELRGERLWEEHDLPPVSATPAAQRDLWRRMLADGVRSPWTTSVGRLFDAVASLAGLRQLNDYEGQAAMAVEFGAGGGGESDTGQPYAFPLTDGVVDWAPAVDTLLADLRAECDRSVVLHRFHAGLAAAVVDVATRYGGDLPVLLTGGCFQNRLLTELCVAALRQAGRLPVWHRTIPPNDGGLALGQIAAAAAEGRLDVSRRSG